MKENKLGNKWQAFYKIFTSYIQKILCPIWSKIQNNWNNTISDMSRQSNEKVLQLTEQHVVAHF